MKKWAVPFLSISIVILWGTILLAQEPKGQPQYRTRKCPETGISENRKVVDYSDHGRWLKPLEGPTPQFNKCGFPSKAKKGKIVFEILINEEGSVECVELLKCDIDDKCLVEEGTKVLKTWTFEAQYDENCNPVAAYKVVAFNVELKRE